MRKWELLIFDVYTIIAYGKPDDQLSGTGKPSLLSFFLFYIMEKLKWMTKRRINSKLVPVIHSVCINKYRVWEYETFE